MGSCAEKCASDHGISRDDQDAYAELSYERSRAAKSFHAQEIVPVEVTQRKKTITVDEDEEPSKDTGRLRSLRPAFLKDGTVTAANASKLNDGAASLVVMSLEECEKAVWSLCVLSKALGTRKENRWISRSRRPWPCPLPWHTPNST